MELRQLEHFLAVAEEGSLTRAAARLHMVQSSLSSSLLNLERELGTDLLTRRRTGAELTDAGRALLARARVVLKDVELARDSVAEVRGLLRGSVRLATVAVPASLNVVEAVSAFHERHPGVDLHLLHDGARDLVELVSTGEADFAITPLTRTDTALLRFESLLVTPLVLLCPSGHPLAARGRELEPEEFLDEVIIDLPQGWWVRDLFDRLVKRSGLSRRVRVEVNEWFGLVRMVKRGVGIGYGPLACLDPEDLDAITPVPIVGAPAWDVGIVTRDPFPSGAAGRAFLADYRRWCDTNLRAQRDEVPDGSERAGSVLTRQQRAVRGTSTAGE